MTASRSAQSRQADAPAPSRDGRQDPTSSARLESPSVARAASSASSLALDVLTQVPGTHERPACGLRRIEQAIALRRRVDERVEIDRRSNAFQRPADALLHRNLAELLSV